MRPPARGAARPVMTGTVTMGAGQEGVMERATRAAPPMTLLGRAGCSEEK